MPALATPARPDVLPDAAERAFVRDTIVQERVGGQFWASALPRSFKAILCVPSTLPLAQARAALHQLTAHHPRQNILLLPSCFDRQGKRLARRLGLACADAHVLDPHAVLDTVRDLCALTPDGPQHDLCLLAALRGLTVRIASSPAGTAQPLTEQAALDHILNDTRYSCPFTSQPTTCRAVLDVLVLWKQTLQANRQVGACMGMSLWKRPQIAAFLASAPGHPAFFRSIPRAVAACRATRRPGVAIWTTRMPTGVEQHLAQAGLTLLRVEDGFIRSIGLGSALQPPASIFLDRRGVYYDPAQPSDLEHILATTVFDDTLRARAQTLMVRLRDAGISKYGKGEPEQPRQRAARSGPVILVPGQVADDLSVLRGGGQIRDNLALLRAVRAARPDAYILYRPHPDVEAGYRKGALPDAVVLETADEISRGGAITSVLMQVDAVHTLTSLAGFEALVRGIPVTTYGTPFYAGWGLTTDQAPVPARRGRALTLAELVAGTLLLYPRYLDPVTHLPCPVEVLLDRFDQPDAWRQTRWMALRRTQMALRQSLPSRLFTKARHFIRTCTVP